MRLAFSFKHVWIMVSVAHYLLLTSIDFFSDDDDGRLLRLRKRSSPWQPTRRSFRPTRVLKELLEPGIEASGDEKSRNPLDVSANTEASHCGDGGMAIECLSGSDGKEGIAKAANLLYSDFYNCDTHGYEKSDTVFTEADMACAPRAVGSGGPEPDLLLVYGPARCHLGFPAWRLRYTEIMHMGPLKSMRYGSIVKALYQFSEKYQNYGK